MKSILVTGATGFLGKHLVEQLMAAEPNSLLRILSRGASPWDTAARPVQPAAGELASCEQEGCPGQNPQVEVVGGDVRSREDVMRAAEGVSEIYHLAGVVSRNPKKKWF